MEYIKTVKGTFVARPNRFVAEVIVNGETVKCHVKNTGRCKELLVKGATVFLEDFEGRMGSRKMRYSLIAVIKNDILINMDSQAPNKVVEEALLDGRIKVPNMDKLIEVKREKTFGNSRFDFYLKDKDGKEAYLEVKGVTLEEKGICKFPDAPTERGIKHIHELIKAKEEGYEAYIVFVIQMKGVKYFTPNYETHKEFGNALKEARAAGVEILAFDSIVKPDFLAVDKEIEIFL